ncbi:Imm1 family immunity protein [Sinanaerobacter sp. ZZT-01]|uniref:Imm1 family immunity protein n=1 Tax=Sinanaerobacter sp. ZZT-01 TaxID=3111540 RepID=UPI002D782C13|nr:Imm1 family immunity protein [Sinanaerobacter sp. ZZT-01]WRR92358.1 Imm1 family immunity protein [Sinanaerobacter sp. ZZT-01]
MRIEHFEGKNECNHVDDIEEILIRRTDKGVNEFIIRGEHEFPYMAVLVNHDYAYLHYYKADDSPGFRSIGGNINLEKEKDIIFYTNTDQEEVSIETVSVLPSSSAVQAVKQFFETCHMPKCIEWEEL